MQLSSNAPNTNFGSYQTCSGLAWTYSGKPFVNRGILEFDLSAIPANAIITDARLQLYPVHSSFVQMRTSFARSNESLIQRITSEWDENTVTWNTQPATTTLNQVTIPAITGPSQAHSANVTQLVQDMKRNPHEAYGFMVRLTTEAYYSSREFASSDSPDANLDPQLVITYTVPAPIPMIGLFVNMFNEILGSSTKEDQLLRYAQKNGFNYLILYDLHKIANLTTASTNAALLASFIEKAKTSYGILQIGASGENIGFFNMVYAYNKNHKLAQRFDVYTLELEYWRGVATYNAYVSLLQDISVLAHKQSILSETYLGWPATREEALQIAASCDRILLHTYVECEKPYNQPCDEVAYTFARDERLKWFGSGSQVINIMPIFSAENQTDTENMFFGKWLLSNPITKPYQTFKTRFTAETAPWKQNINLLGHVWFKYTNMPGYSTARKWVDATEPAAASLTFSIYPNPYQEGTTIEYFLKETTSVTLEVYNSQGRKVCTLLKNAVQAAGKQQELLLAQQLGLPTGMYVVKLATPGSVQLKKIIQLP